MNILIKGLVKEYEKVALSIDELFIEGGKIVALLGLNGSGKTTLLECIANFKGYDKGIIYYDGEEDFERVRNKISIMQQRPYIFNMPVKENIILGLRYQRLDTKIIEERLKKYNSYYNLNFLDKNAKKLSGGEAAKVALLRAVILERPLLLLDEPTANMDIEGTLMTEKLLKDINKEFGTTILIVTHDIFQAERIADIVIFMDKGKIIEMNTNEEFFNNPKNPLVKKILKRGEVND
ncbi:ABC transporter ATP-binding protein [Caloramator australicus]|uniref:ABC-type tungstate transport system, ATP-binding protein n=1 Tax=Caloramator australicus RC3 TaxID=857293 RepID=G0V4L7_9CLOT|nr:ATP-binding cassette domain-containing protein [Caloramator australicus]CCC58057.1 ABC-type tungstate transport system, ATP-binding protein [Caloramator australicus RC3]